MGQMGAAALGYPEMHSRRRQAESCVEENPRRDREQRRALRRRAFSEARNPVVASRPVPERLPAPTSVSSADGMDFEWQFPPRVQTRPTNPGFDLERESRYVYSQGYPQRGMTSGWLHMQKVQAELRAGEYRMKEASGRVKQLQQWYGGLQNCLRYVERPAKIVWSMRNGRDWGSPSPLYWHMDLDAAEPQQSSPPDYDDEDIVL